MIKKIELHSFNQLAKIPQTPNFILMDTRSGENFPAPIAEVSDKELYKLADAWTENLIAKARKRRKSL